MVCSRLLLLLLLLLLSLLLLLLLLLLPPRLGGSHFSIATPVIARGWVGWERAINEK